MYNGQTPSRLNPENWGGHINWLTSGELNRSIVSKTIEKITEKGMKDALLRVVPKGTFVISITGLEAAGTRGNCAILAIDTTLNQSCMALYPNKNLLDSEFLFQWYRKVGEKYGIRYTQGTKQQSYNAELIKILPISLPSLSEQFFIKELLFKLDQTITLQQRRLELLKKLKRGYLQQMFPAKNQYSPRLRFGEFNGDWEQHKFYDTIKDIVDFRGRTPKKLGMDWSKSGYLALSALNVKNGYIDFSSDAHYGNKELYNKWMDGKDLYKGQVLFTTEAPMGNVAQVPDNDKYILSQRTIAFRVRPDKITDDFLALLLRSPKTVNELSSLASGGTAKGVSQKSLGQFKVNLPANLEEQKEISIFFKCMNNIDALQQSKIEHQQQLKQAYLQKLFP